MTSERETVPNCIPPWNLLSQVDDGKKALKKFAGMSILLKKDSVIGIFNNFQESYFSLWQEVTIFWEPGYVQKQPPDVFFKETVFLEISQNSQEFISARVSFLIKL